MKTTFLSIVALIVSGGMYAQNTILLSNNETSKTLTPNEIIYLKTEAESNTKVTIDVKNIGNSTQAYIAKRYDMLLNSDGTLEAQAYFCIAGSCYGPPTLISPAALTLTPNQSASELPGSWQMLVADLDEVTTVGPSHVKYTFQNIANPSDSVQISLKYNSPDAPGGIVGINKLQKIDGNITISPVPATDKINLNLNSDQNGSCNIILINSIGKIVYEKNYQLANGKNDIEISVADLAKGVYFAKIISENISLTKKFVVNK